MKPFTAPVDDILFSLEQLADASHLTDWDAALANEIATHFATYAEKQLAPLDESGDKQGCTLNNGRVTMPDGFVTAYKEYATQGWPGISAPEEFGGQGMGAVVQAITSEIFSGACHSLQMVTGLVPGAIRTLLHFGTEDQQQRHIPPLASGQTIATMCLTEPGAGSDLSMVRCAAVPDKQGSNWHITGDKIFISGGDQDMSEHILHLVLARTSDEGVRGLSLFLCSDQTPAGRNAITVTRIEEKMGLHASPTCQLSFDHATAELIGNPGDGLRAMFTMMNHARLDVALQGVAHAARVFDVASAYTADRKQGRNSGRETISLNQHADVARILDEIDACALGGRAIAHLALTTLESGHNPDLVEFLTPVAKVCCSEAGIKAAELGMQVLGGYGYLAEYRLEQCYRDARVCAIYEGANGIHERALVERYLTGSNAKSADAFDAFLARRASEDNATQMANTLEIWRQARIAITRSPDPARHAHHFMKLTTDALLHGIWSKYLSVSEQHRNPERISRVSNSQLLKINAFLPARLSMILTT